MSTIGDSSPVMNSIATNGFLRECIELAVDGFLFRGITPADHYYRFSQSFPRASTLGTSAIALVTTPKSSHHHHHHHSHTSSSTSKHSSIHHSQQQQRSTHSIPPLDLSSLNSNNHILLEQQPVVSTIMPTNTHHPSQTGLTIKTKKPVYSPKDSLSSSSTTDRRIVGSARRPTTTTTTTTTKTPLVTSNTPNTPHSSNEPSPLSSVNPKRPITAPTPSSDNWLSPQPLSPLESEARDIQDRMGKHRLRHGRPHDLSQMTSKQIFDEKSDMQQELLRFENKYSKPTTSEQKRIMKPLYDYYRQLKRLVEKQQQQQ